jgi:hypothetical protein
MTETTTTNGHCVGTLPDATTTTPVDSSKDYCRLFLEPWVREHVIVTGIFSDVQRKVGMKRSYLNGFFTHVEIELPDRARHYLDHINVGSIEAICHVARGSRIRFRAKVNRYPNKHHPEEQRYGVQFPVLLDVVAPPHMPEVVTAEPVSVPPSEPVSATATIDILAALTELVARVRQAGRQKAVRDLLAAIELAGGWDAVERVRLLVGQLGGAEKLGQFLDLLKGD